MNEELIEIFKSLRTWSTFYGACKGGFGELEIASKCDFKCSTCPIFQTENPRLYSNQIVSIPLN